MSDPEHIDKPEHIRRLNRLSDEGARLESEIKQHRIRLDSILEEIKAERSKKSKAKKSK